MQKENSIWGMLGKALEIIAPIVIVGLVTWCTWATSQFREIDVKLAQLDQWRSSRPVFVTAPELESAQMHAIDKMDEIAGKKFDQIQVQLLSLQREVTTFSVMLAEHMKQNQRP